MIEALLKLVEKLTELVKLRKEAEEKPFKLLIMPLYENLELIHADYLKLFESCRAEIEAYTELEVIAQKLMTDRLEQEALRRSAMAFVRSYAENPRLERFSAFLQAIVMYLYGAELEAMDTRSGELLRAMEHWVREQEKTKFLAGFRGRGGIAQAREILAELTAHSLSELRGRWQEVSGEFSKLNARRAT